MKLHMHRLDESVIVLTVDGGLDGHTSRELTEELERLIAQGWSRIVLDCSSLVYISSWGIATLVKLHRECKHLGGDVKLVNPQNFIFEVLRTTHLDQMFEMYETIDRARLAFRPEDHWQDQPDPAPSSATPSMGY